MLCNLLELITFFQNLLKKYILLSNHIYNLLHDNVFQLTPELEQIFNKIKNTMTSLKLNLQYQTQNIHFFIRLDASIIGLGAVLFQLNEQNKMKCNLIYLTISEEYLLLKNNNSQLWIKNY